jgi:predicted DNA-binding transcriptional regulator AlpA
MRDPESDRMLTTKEAACLLGLGTSMLERLRWMGEGPPWIRPTGRRVVRYRQGDIRSWIDSHRVNPTGELGR